LIRRLSAEDGVFRRIGRAKVFVSESAAIAAIKAKEIQAGDVLVLICRGPMGAGMEETYQITGALRHLPFGKDVAVITDARFSGVSTGACIGHISPEALAGGPIGKLRDGDLIEIVINQRTQEASVDFLGDNPARTSREEGIRTLAARAPRSDLAADGKPSGRHADLGSTAGCEWRSVGRSCVRCRINTPRYFRR
jgi:dihydroxyacid dehydratase/phosphogluconate dehydratase